MNQGAINKIHELPSCSDLWDSHGPWQRAGETERSIIYQSHNIIIKTYTRDPPQTLREPHLHLQAHKAGIAPRILCATLQHGKITAVGQEDAGPSLDRAQNPRARMGEAAALLARAHHRLARVPPCPDRPPTETRPGDWARHTVSLQVGRSGLMAIPEPPAEAGWRPGTLHGDPHLGQFLDTSQELLLTDWEGEPGRPPRLLCSRAPVLRDLAVLARSLDYHAAIQGGRRPDPQSLALDLLDSYQAPRRLLPGVLWWMLERALYEVWYEERYSTGLSWIPRTAVGVLLELF